MTFFWVEKLYNMVLEMYKNERLKQKNRIQSHFEFNLGKYL